MAGQGGVVFCIDESFGRPMADILCRVRAPGSPGIRSLHDLGFSGAKDEVWLGALSDRGVQAVVTRDSRILKATIRRDVWRAAGLTLFVLEAKWSELRLFDQVRGLVWWWPNIFAQADGGPRGAAWRIPVPPAFSGKMTRLFAEL